MRDAELARVLVHLERRVAALEKQLAVRAPEGAPAILEAAQPATPETPLPSAPEMAPAPGVRSRRDPRPPVPDVPRADPIVDLEQWVGARGLLLVGVVALLMAAAFFLKYAFDRGWIAPWLRIVAAIGSGILVAVLGERLAGRGLRRYGLALVGAGGGLAYLGLWAAAGPYALTSRGLGVLGIAAVASLMAWRAAHHDIEALALWALLGAFLAPVLLPSPDAHAETFLAYLGVVTFAAATLSAMHRWRFALALGLAGYFLLAGGLVPGVLHTPLGLLYLGTGGVLALRVAGAQTWPESRFGAPLLAWLLLIVHATQATTTGARWAAGGAALALLLVTYWRDRRLTSLRSDQVAFPLNDETGVFAATPFACALVVASVSRGMLADHPGVVPAAIGAAYLATGWRGKWAPFVAVGAVLVAIGTAVEFSGAARVALWSAFVLGAVLADRRFDQGGLAAVALAVAAVALPALLLGQAFDRGHTAAFASAWPLSLYAYVAAMAVAANRWRPRPEQTWARNAVGTLWALAGAALFAGVSNELRHLFDARHGWAGPGLAGDLATSVWWLVFAAATVRIGFWLDRQGVRQAGLAVAGLAAVKIALFDLSRLEALYRVGSFFALALIALALAYAYNRRARRTGAPN